VLLINNTFALASTASARVKRNNVSVEKNTSGERNITKVTKDLTDQITTNIYYVSTQGNDSNPGTISKPWKTIQKAAESVKPGDTVYIRGGIYKERINLKTSGSVNKYITFANYTGEVVTIDGRNIDWGYDWNALFNLNSQHYIQLKGLRVINSRWFGIGSTPDSNGSENIIIQNCSTYNTKASGIAIYRGSNIIIDGNSVEKACTGTDNTQECISLCEIDTFEIKNNHVFNCTNDLPSAGGEGIDAKNGSSNGKIFNNTVNDVVKLGIYIDAYSKHQYNIEVYDNVIYNSVQGIVVATENNGLLENVRVYNNTIYNCTDWGLAVAGWGCGKTHAMKDIFFDSNNIKSVGTSGIFLNNPDAKNVVITNNTFARGNNPDSIPFLIQGANLKEITIDQ
jgi:hypothetical protein